MKFLTSVITLLTFLVSCSSEKVTLSPIQSSMDAASASRERTGDNFTEKSGKIFYASELSSHMSTFPKFRNSALNEEVGDLKFHVKEYVYAVQAYNLVGQERALEKVESSYKKIQKLRRYLSPSDNEVINRYLVRIKSNIAQLELLSRPPGGK